MYNWVRHWPLPTCSFTLKLSFERPSKSVCKQGVRGSSPLGSTSRNRASSAPSTPEAT
jgi:hypothetical protein